jgi:hypothetical protein
MPDEFIRFRHFFRDNGLMAYWRTLFHSLSEEEKTRLIDLLCKRKLNKSIRGDGHLKRVKKMLVLYTLDKSQFDRGERSYQSVVTEVELT